MSQRLPERLWALSRSLYRGDRRFAARLVKTLNWAIHKCLLPEEAIVGDGVILEHHALGIVMHPQVTIGDGCRIFHHVTLAAECAIGSEHRIMLGGNVSIGAHSIVVAREGYSLHIGDNSILGAGSVLTKDVPPGQVWAGNPAHLIRTLLTVIFVSLLFAGCADDTRHRMIISAADQKMVLLRDGKPIAVYPVSTSKFGLGDRPGSNATPLGRLRVKKKIGAGAPAGAVFKSRRPTGEVLPVDAPGRDPIVTRILWLEGTGPENRHAFGRCIYIHGTPEERNIGHPASYGCIRMRSSDVIGLFDTVGLGARVFITARPLPHTR
ncbi:MAG: L,D-transpeptidase family protein [Terrimicrobiaceae bacterium]